MASTFVLCLRSFSRVGEGITLLGWDDGAAAFISFSFAGWDELSNSRVSKCRRFVEDVKRDCKYCRW